MFGVCQVVSRLKNKRMGIGENFATQLELSGLSTSLMCLNDAIVLNKQRSLLSSLYFLLSLCLLDRHMRWSIEQVTRVRAVSSIPSHRNALKISGPCRCKRRVGFAATNWAHNSE